MVIFSIDPLLVPAVIFTFFYYTYQTFKDEYKRKNQNLGQQNKKSPEHQNTSFLKNMDETRLSSQITVINQQITSNLDLIPKEILSENKNLTKKSCCLNCLLNENENELKKLTSHKQNKWSKNKDESLFSTKEENPQKNKKEILSDDKFSKQLLDKKRPLEDIREKSLKKDSNHSFKRQMDNELNQYFYRDEFVFCDFEKKSQNLIKTDEIKIDDFSKVEKKKKRPEINQIYLKSIDSVLFKPDDDDLLQKKIIDKKSAEKICIEKVKNDFSIDVKINLIEKNESIEPSIENSVDQKSVSLINPEILNEKSEKSLFLQKNIFETKKNEIINYIHTEIEKTGLISRKLSEKSNNLFKNSSPSPTESINSADINPLSKIEKTKLDNIVQEEKKQPLIDESKSTLTNINQKSTITNTNPNSNPFMNPTKMPMFNFDKQETGSTLFKTNPITSIQTIQSPTKENTQSLFSNILNIQPQETPNPFKNITKEIPEEAFPDHKNRSFSFASKNTDLGNNSNVFIKPTFQNQKSDSLFTFENKPQGYIGMNNNYDLLQNNFQLENNVNSGFWNEPSKNQSFCSQTQIGQSFDTSFENPKGQNEFLTLFNQNNNNSQKDKPLNIFESEKNEKVKGHSTYFSPKNNSGSRNSPGQTSSRFQNPGFGQNINLNFGTDSNNSLFQSNNMFQPENAFNTTNLNNQSNPFISKK